MIGVGNVYFVVGFGGYVGDFSLVKVDVVVMYRKGVS